MANDTELKSFLDLCNDNTFFKLKGDITDVSVDTTLLDLNKVFILRIGEMEKMVDLQLPVTKRWFYQDYNRYLSLKLKLTLVQEMILISDSCSSTPKPLQKLRTIS